MKFLLVVMVYCLLYTVANTLLPFSEGFMDAASETDPSSMLFILISGGFICLVICYIVSRSKWRGVKSAAGTALVIFVVQSVMTQIETLFFAERFPALTTIDILLIMSTPLPPLFAASLLAVRFFGDRPDNRTPIPSPSLPRILPRLFICGAVYVAVYFLFGYFVAWQSEALRIFYSGSAQDAGFIGQLQNNLTGNPIIYPFQFFRGMLFCLAVLPLLSMFWPERKRFVLAVCLVFLCSAVVLVIPNPLFPDAVRLAHLAEMASSMLVFGLAAGNIICPD